VFGSKGLVKTLRSAKIAEKHQEVVGIIFERLDVNELETAELDILLKYAVTCGHRKVVATLIDHGKCNVNQCKKELYKRMTDWPLISHASDPIIVKLLLDAEAVVDNRHYESVFAASCRNLRLDSVKMLLEAKADVNRGYYGGTTLQHAICAPCTDEQAEDKVAIIKLLIEARAHTCGLRRHRTALGACMDAPESSNRVITAKALLFHDPNWKTPREANDEVPLLIACRASERDPAVFRALIDAGEDVNWMNPIIACLILRLGDDFTKHSPRITRDILHMLLDAGANPFIESEGLTLLMLVLRYELYEDDRGTDAVHSVLISYLLEFILHSPDIATLSVTATTETGDHDSDSPCLPV
jgi:ankyrin repeat protein